ncbi:hypothetical protein [Burkholderia orbicola]|uniref:hypothetical protein n=1 Tax=Burkholderia cepacia complex TaxID=87882 RepID=UPI003B8A9760
MTELFAELMPVDNELMPVEVDVDSDVIELLADDRPVEVEVDSEVIELFAEDRPVDVEVDNESIELVANLSAFLWARRLNNRLSTRLRESLAEQDSKLVHR